MLTARWRTLTSATNFRRTFSRPLALPGYYVHALTSDAGKGVYRWRRYSTFDKALAGALDWFASSLIVDDSGAEISRYDLIEIGLAEKQGRNLRLVATLDRVTLFSYRNGQKSTNRQGEVYDEQTSSASPVHNFGQFPPDFLWSAIVSDVSATTAAYRMRHSTKTDARQDVLPDFGGRPVEWRYIAITLDEAQEIPGYQDVIDNDDDTNDRPFYVALDALHLPVTWTRTVEPSALITGLAPNRDYVLIVRDTAIECSPAIVGFKTAQVQEPNVSIRKVDAPTLYVYRHTIPGSLNHIQLNVMGNRANSPALDSELTGAASGPIRLQPDPATGGFYIYFTGLLDGGQPAFTYGDGQIGSTIGLVNGARWERLPADGQTGLVGIRLRLPAIQIAHGTTILFDIAANLFRSNPTNPGTISRIIYQVRRVTNPSFPLAGIPIEPFGPYLFPRENLGGQSYSRINAGNGATEETPHGRVRGGEPYYAVMNGVPYPVMTDEQEAANVGVEIPCNTAYAIEVRWATIYGLAPNLTVSPFSHTFITLACDAVEEEEEPEDVDINDDDYSLLEELVNIAMIGLAAFLALLILPELLELAAVMAANIALRAGLTAVSSAVAARVIQKADALVAEGELILHETEALTAQLSQQGQRLIPQIQQNIQGAGAEWQAIREQAARAAAQSGERYIEILRNLR